MMSTNVKNENLKKRILMVSTRVPFPLTSGVRLKNYHLAKAYKEKGFIVDLLLISLERRHVLDPDMELDDVFENIIEFRISMIRAFLNICIGLFTIHPIQCMLYRNNQAKDWLLTNYINYEFCQFMLVRTYLFYKIIPSKFKLLDMADILSKTYKQISSSKKPFVLRYLYMMEARRLSSLESQLYNDDAIKTLFNYDEVSAFPSKYNIRHVLHGTSLTRVDVRPKLAHRACGNIKIGFTGNLSYEPNVQAIHYIIRTLQTLQINWMLTIVGANAGEKLKFYLSTLKNVELLENVKNIEDVVLNFDFVYAPVLNGGGIQNKILEALALGVPVLTNSKGASAFIPEVKRHIFVADSSCDQISFMNKFLAGTVVCNTEQIRKDLKKYYDWDSSAQSYIEAYYDCS